MISAFALLALVPLLATAAPTKRASGLTIAHNNDANKCLGVVDKNVGDGTLVSSVPCDTKDALTGWDLAVGDNLSVRLTGTDYCLDAGTNPHNNVELKIWTCYPGLDQQRWWLTDDRRIAITGGDQCVDLRSDGVPQTYQCTTGNTNQVWYVSYEIPPTVPTDPTDPTEPTEPTDPTEPTEPTEPTGPSTLGYQIHPNGDDSLCLTVGYGYGGQGTAVNINHCAEGPANATGLNQWQRWTIQEGATKIQLVGTDFCLDAGEPMGDGVRAKIWNCHDGPQQSWWFTGPVDRHIAIEGGNQCLDVIKESVAVPAKPYGSVKDVGTWSCSGPDPNQIWTVSE